VSLLLLTASCVPAIEAAQTSLVAPGVQAAAALPQGAAPVPPDANPLTVPTLLGDGAVAANAAIPLSGLINPAASSFVVRARTPIDQMRSLDCLAQAIYYEAGSESEEGQRAVAQVVLNRMRHPSWPNSVCGVVYQGPMRAGGGCQFTFTCDGSLARRAGGYAWLQARRIAAAALAGQTYAPVGHSTHYHTQQVLPAWAPRLAKTTVIGAHIFYRLPGNWGEPQAFRQRYAGAEPIPRPVLLFPRQTELPPLATASLPILLPQMPQPSPQLPYAVGQTPTQPAQTAQAVAAAAEAESQIREEYRHSGQWRADAPIAPAR
jgi:spore germination cell wall hydrolase CwlJ-like protein